jgi:hypothetical protein
MRFDRKKITLRNSEKLKTYNTQTIQNQTKALNLEKISASIIHQNLEKKKRKKSENRRKKKEKNK